MEHADSVARITVLGGLNIEMWNTPTRERNKHVLTLVRLNESLMCYTNLSLPFITEFTSSCQHIYRQGKTGTYEPLYSFISASPEFSVSSNVFLYPVEIYLYNNCIVLHCNAYRIDVLIVDIQLR